MNMHKPTEDLLQTYRAVEDCSALMLAAARDQNWNLVAETQQHCDRLIGSLRRSVVAHDWTAERQHARLGILRSVLRNEAELRRLTFPEAAQLDRMLAHPR